MQVALLALIAGVATPSFAQSRMRDTQSDTWAATDALGRVLPDHSVVGSPRKRFVGIFYFLRDPARAFSRPLDVSEILRQNPSAIKDGNDPLWGPVGATHFWGRPLFDYYRSEDEYVLRKHAQMLSDAGVDVIVFDVTNRITFTSQYMRLLKVFSAVRANGGRTPQIAFICPFFDPARVVRQLFHDLYGPGFYPDLWFRWKGKPLILADPTRLGEHNLEGFHQDPIDVEAGKPVGQSFTSQQVLEKVGVRFATYGKTDTAVTISLYGDRPGGRLLARENWANLADNEWRYLALRRPLRAGRYYLELSEPKGRVAWWTDTGPRFFEGQTFVNRVPAAGVRSLDIVDRGDQDVRLSTFFTFRAPQADYFAGPTKPDMWSWLEVSPQHVFPSARDPKEQMSVGVAQNAVNGKLSSMSQPGAQGRSWHGGREDDSEGAVNHGFNFQEQFERALTVDPEFVFVTGWNEWTADRQRSFPNTDVPVILVDEFNQEFSRDIEPMAGGHGDDYYYQLAALIRRYKGVRPTPIASEPKTIDLHGGFDQWNEVGPAYLDDVGDASGRDSDGWNHGDHFLNATGRNDFAVLKVARDRDYLYFYAQTRDPISPRTDPSWMTLFLRVSEPGTTWEGYRYIVNRVVRDDATSTLEESLGGWNWREVAPVRFRVQGNELMLAIRRSDIGLGDASKPFTFEFKWMDNMQVPGDINEFTLNGDAAPNGRFNYVYRTVNP